MKVFFATFGCKVNQYESQAMMQLLETHGYQTEEWSGAVSETQEVAVVVNSCTVTAESDRKMRQMLRRIKRICPQSILVLTGCFVQAFAEKAKQLDMVDIFLGNAERRELPRLLQEYCSRRERLVHIPKHTAQYEPLTVRRFEGRTRAFVKIEDGCDRFCSYCIIPYARGRVRSLPLALLTEQVRCLASQGFREVVLVGINLTAYGKDIGCNIADAVEAACAVDGIERVRLGSLEPDHVTDEIIGRLAACRQLCPQFHIALQSGCDATLARMKRRYTTQQYRQLCNELQKAFPQCTLTTDIMVGFPGETQQDFETSLQFCREIGFARMHVFAYSRRSGTPADVMPDQVPESQKALRAKQMGELAQQLAEHSAQALVGRTVEVLAETKTDDGRYEGYTDTYLPVRFAFQGEAGQMCSVHIVGQENGVCIGV